MSAGCSSRVCALVAVVWVGTLVSAEWRPIQAQSAGQFAPSATGSQRAVFAQYCLTCHNQRMKEAGSVPVAFEGDSLWDIGANAPTWEKVVLKMRAGLMPPAGARRPDQSARAEFLGWLEGELDRAAAAHPNPGRTEPFHRLNRTEYRNAVRDLLALDLDVSSMLPADDSSYGFDNIAGVLKMSPTLMCTRSKPRASIAACTRSPSAAPPSTPSSTATSWQPLARRFV